ncbi:MAG TPA: hypothetical protein VFH80_08845 [Solirubrobacteraceae bacterium]|nr:hypothetical protein [Solirubrobacteraceae bacterium]
MGHFSKPVAALGTAGVLILAGGAYALASSHAGTITACVHHKGGALYVAKKCARHDKTLSWNKQGWPGSIGPQGPAGATGPQGAPGITTAFSGSITGPVMITSDVTPGDKVGHLDLQPGSYVIFAKAWIENQSATTTTTAGCELDAGTDSDKDDLKLEPTGTNAFRGAVSLNVAHTFTSAGPAQLSCFTGSGVIVTANNVAVTAIPVASLTGNELMAG